MADKLKKKYRLSKIFKRALALFIIVIINFNSYAAVVSSNDGSAFITKAEFDALVNDFNSRIEDYEKSIDAKIDGAIAEYLAGLATTNYEQMEPLISNYTDIRWMHGPYMYFTNRKFTAYADASGNYNDTVKWQIINPENRRQTAGDGYFWFKDFLFDSFAMATVAFRMHPYNVPKGWGTGRGGSAATTSRGPSIYVCARNEDTGWAVYNEDGGIRGEQGHRPQVVIRPHKPTSSFSGDPLTYMSGINSDRLLLNKTDSTDVSITANALTSAEIANYTLNGLELRNIAGASDGRIFTGDVRENVKLDSKPLTNNNPAVLVTVNANLWEGSGGTDLKVGCGYAGFMGDNYNRRDDGLVEDNRWKTRSQYRYDNANFVYSMWGSDVSGDTNVAPPARTEGEGTFLDLSTSGNVVTIPVKIKHFAFVLANPYNGYTQRPDFVRYYSSVPGSVVGTMNFNIPLFYRVNWKDMLSGEFKYEGKSLSKSAGYPFVKKIPGVGKIQIKIKYQERSNTDTSVVSLTPDQKIKTYFKNKPFTDTTGTYLTGYTNINGEGTEVTLNGNEWTSGEITVLIPVEKDDEIWMRIDPLTEDGVYCQMTNMECTFITE